MAPARFSTGIRLSEAQMEALKRAAKADNRPVASLGELIVTDWLRSQGWLKQDAAQLGKDLLR